MAWRWVWLLLSQGRGQDCDEVFGDVFEVSLLQKAQHLSRGRAVKPQPEEETACSGSFRVCSAAEILEPHSELDAGAWRTPKVKESALKPGLLEQEGVQRGPVRRWMVPDVPPSPAVLFVAFEGDMAMALRQGLGLARACDGARELESKRCARDGSRYLDRHFLSCEGSSSSSGLGGSSIIRFRVDVDRPGLLSEATEVLKKQHVNIRDARISTEEGSKRATHIYFVEESGERKARGGLSEERLAEVRAALTQLASGSCEAEPWPIFSSEEVSKHQTPSTGIWVSYKDGVYDITDFVQNHPGGKDKIMLAAGKAIDPFWRIYQQHTGRGNALELLESMRIGDLSDPPDTTRTASDPYDTDPERHPGLIFHNNKPCNAELPSELMMDSWLTPNPVWFIRHHHPVPEVNPEDYRLCIEGVGTKAVTLCLEDLKKRFLKREVVATLQCGGNRRSELDQIEKTSGIPWGFGAMSTARWGGVYLREVLQHCAGLSHENVEAFDVKHVIFKGMDGMEASIPIEKALSPYGDVLLAYEMNGEALPNEHGAPVRVIVPGVVGVRNVKWVGRVVASTEEAEGPWQRGLAYKGFSPMVKARRVSSTVCKGTSKQ
ncbi:SUOX [Symbiodinium sp. CCMP2456]|nr:SUOX [Symbiodinium sp. CCMP2456]